MKDEIAAGHSLIHAGQREERRKAIRGLIAHPIMREEDRQDLFVLVLRHQVWLREWFEKNTGWDMTVNLAGRFARLYKLPASPDPHRALTAANRRPFDRRRYSLACLVMAVLEEAAGQTTLRVLAEQVEALSAGDSGLPVYDPTRLAERRALVDALVWLERMGVLAIRDGETERYSRSAGADALYDVDERLLGQMIAAPVPPSLAEGPGRMAPESYADSPEGRRKRARHAVLRRLIDDPVLYFRDLPDEERDWLDHSRGFVYALLEEDLGLQPESRREGLAAVDPAAELSDERFPDGSSTVKHAALLLCEILSDRARRAAGGANAVPVGEVIEVIQELMSNVGQQGRWSSVFTADEHGAEKLARSALDLLCGFGLARMREDSVQALPAMARFRPSASAGGEV
ncbi:MAG: TIGR02678 family protein [Deltaproteobacteria bacterium]|nr:TIGR02678 family protein [Deltaproteobacteria bacterium]